jgi:putative flavoprotein involved in K+ transport
MKNFPGSLPLPTVDGMSTERFDIIVIGGGQAGLATGYHLRGRGPSFVILEAHDRIGESWRRRWDGLRVFTPARNDGLPGMPFPAPGHSFPTKDEIADYLEGYAKRMDLPIRTGVHVDSLDRADDGGFVICAGNDRYEASQVVVATGGFSEPRVPDFATELDPDISQLHSSEYRDAGQLRDGPVLVVGASNSGGEIAYSTARAGHETWLSGRDVGQMPFDINGRVARSFDIAFWPFVHHVLTLRNPLGRRVRPAVTLHGGPLERVRKRDLEAAGVRRIVGRTVGVSDGRPLLDDGKVLDVRTVVWATGFRHAYPWIRAPVIGPDGWPEHERGAARSTPGLYFVGLPFQYGFTSQLIGGVGRDALYVAERIGQFQASRSGATHARALPQPRR